MKLYQVTHGDVGVLLTSRESAQEAVRAIESADPYGGIPFIFESEAEHLEALNLVSQNAMENLLRYLEVVYDDA